MTTPTPGCTVRLADTYVDVCWNGRITKNMAAQCNADIIEKAKQLLATGKPVHVRFQALNPPVVPNMDAFSEAIKIFNSDIPFKRAVIWGDAPRLVRMLFNVLVDSFSADHEIKYIKDETAALRWLLEDSSIPQPS